MTPAIPVLLALALGLAGWLAARARAWTMRSAVRAEGAELHSLPIYYAWYVALWAALPAVLFAAVWAAVSPGLVLTQVLTDPAALAAAIATLSGLLGWKARSFIWKGKPRFSPLLRSTNPVPPIESAAVRAPSMPALPTMAVPPLTETPPSLSVP